MSTAQHWPLVGYDIEYFCGTKDLPDLLKQVRRFVRDSEKHVASVHINKDMSIGWTAEVIVS